MTNRSNRPYMPPTHKNNAPPLSSNCHPLQNHDRPKKEICYTEPCRTCFCIPYFVSISHTFFNLLRFSPLPRPCLLSLPFLILSRPLPILCFSFPVIFHIPHFFFHTASFPFFPSELSPQSLSLFHFRLPCYRFSVPPPPRRRFFPHPVFPVCRFPPRIFPIFFARLLV